MTFKSRYGVWGDFLQQFLFVFCFFIFLQSCTHFKQNSKKNNFSKQVNSKFLKQESNYYFLKSEILSLEGNLDAAILALKEAQKHSFSSEFLQLELAKKYMAKARLFEALEILQQILEKNPRSFATKHFLAEIYKTHKMYDKALKEYNELLKWSPENPEILLSQAQVLLMDLQPKKSLRILEKLFLKKEELKDPSSLYDLLALNYQVLKKWKKVWLFTILCLSKPA